VSECEREREREREEKVDFLLRSFGAARDGPPPSFYLSWLELCRHTPTEKAASAQNCFFFYFNLFFPFRSNFRKASLIHNKRYLIIEALNIQVKKKSKQSAAFKMFYQKNVHCLTAKKLFLF
jgi:hypothetical protein